MPEYIYVSLEVGGKLPVSIVPEFLDCVNKDIIPDDNKLYTLDDLIKNELFKVYGQAEYGMCTQTKDFCIKHGLYYVCRAGSSGEYDADTTFYVPGMEEESTYKTDQNGEATVRLDQVKPFFDLMIALAEQDIKALPKFLNNRVVADLVKDCLDSPADIIKHLKERLSEVLPQEAPDIPPLIIDETK